MSTLSPYQSPSPALGSRPRGLSGSSATLHSDATEYHTVVSAPKTADGQTGWIVKKSSVFSRSKSRKRDRDLPSFLGRRRHTKDTASTALSISAITNVAAELIAALSEAITMVSRGTYSDRQLAIAVWVVLGVIFPRLILIPVTIFGFLHMRRQESHHSRGRRRH